MAMLGAGATTSALAGPSIPLGEPLGLSLGNALGQPFGGTLGSVLGVPLGDVLPASSAVLLVAAVTLGVAIHIARRKRHR